MSVDEREFSINFVALAALGLGLIGQAVPAALCMLRADSYIVSWSSDPLTTPWPCSMATARSATTRIVA